MGSNNFKIVLGMEQMRQPGRSRVTPDFIRQCKTTGHRITMLTAYDYPTARCAQHAGIDIVFASDAFAMVGLGRPNTFAVTVDEVIYHTKAVKAGSGPCLVLASMPFLSYATEDTAIQTARRIIQEGGADAVEIEGDATDALKVRRLVDNGIPVVAHIGLTKQMAARSGTHRIQGRSVASAYQMICDALAMQKAGAFCVVIECAIVQVAEAITRILEIPTIGFGSGFSCNGQALVSQDMLGLYDVFRPRFVRIYADIAQQTIKAFEKFREDVQVGSFPAMQESTFGTDELLLDQVADYSRNVDAPSLEDHVIEAITQLAQSRGNTCP